MDTGLGLELTVVLGVTFGKGCSWSLSRAELGCAERALAGGVVGMAVGGAAVVVLLLEGVADSDLIIGISNSCPPATVPP